MIKRDPKTAVSSNSRVEQPPQVEKKLCASKSSLTTRQRQQLLAGWLETVGAAIPSLPPPSFSLLAANLESPSKGAGFLLYGILIAEFISEKTNQCITLLV